MILKNIHHPDNLVAGYKLTKEDLKKVNNYSLPYWCQKFMVYKEIHTFVKIKNRNPNKGMHSDDNPTYNLVTLKETDWLILHPKLGLLMYNNSTVTQNYKTCRQ